MKFLVTGGAGFIGSHVCESLVTGGDEVWSVDDLNPFYDVRIKQNNLKSVASRSKNCFRAIECDINTDAAELQAVFDAGPPGSSASTLAGQSRECGSSLESPALYQRVNVEGTVNVLESARKSGVTKLILARIPPRFMASTLPCRSKKAIPSVW